MLRNRHTDPGCLLARQSFLGLVVLLSLTRACHLVAADCFSAPSGLVCWWPGDGNANDIAGTNNGTLQGGATVNAVGVVGSAFNFDGTNGYVQIPDSPALKPTNLTVEAWIRFASLNSPGNTADAGQQYIIFKQNSRNGNFEGYDLGKVRSSSQDFFVFRVAPASGVGAQVVSTTNVTTGVWYHVAGVRGTNFVQLYVNGQLQSQTNVSFAQDYGTFPVYFGSSGQSFWDRKFSGTLDEVSLYNRALSSNEIAAVYSAGAAGKCKGASILTQPQSQTLVAGTNATFAVAATGFGVLSYQWLFNGTNVAGARNPYLTLTDVQPTNAGSYTVVVSNSLASATSGVAVLTVLVPPAITSPPISRTNECSSTATFTVAADGTVPLSYQWYFNGSPINNAVGSSLTVTNLHATQQGNYVVVVTNSAGSVTGAPPVTLTIVDTTPPVVTLNGPNPLTNECHAALVDPGATVSDTCAGSVGVTTNSTVNPNAVGAYTIKYIATDPSGNSATNTRTVYVVDTTTPVITLNGANPLTNECYTVFVDPGASASDTCAGSLAVTTNSTLNPNAVGVYTIKYAATDSSGNSATNTRTVYVVLTATSPIITLQPQSRTNVAGTAANFSVTATGVAPLNYQWQFNGGNIEGATGSNLTFTSVQPTNAGNYAVLVTNVAGSVTSALAALTVLVPPAITAQPQSVTNMAGTAANFSLTATGTPPPAYQWQLNGISLTGATSSTLAISYVLWAPCQTGASRVYSVVVANAAGSVTSAPATLTVTGLPVESPLSLDPNLEAAVRGALSKLTGALVISNLWALTSLTACGQHITNLWGLEYATNLTSLYLPGNGISDLAPLQCLNKLVQLGLYHNHIGDLSPLATLTSLTNLNAGDNSIGDGSPLLNLTGLTTLWLYGNSISHVTFLKNLTQLNSLALDRNNLTDISPLTNLTSLSLLALGGNPALTNYDVLENLTNLVSLSLRESPIACLGVLRPMSRLACLDLYSNPINSISPLTNLTSLNRLDLSWDFSITNCAVLGGSTSLNTLYLRGISITNATFLTNLYRLSFLNLDSTRLTNASPLSGLTNLTCLTMTGNPAVADFSALSNLTGLINLELRANSISNVAFLSTLSRLGYADLAYNSIGDISPLAGLTNLNSLVLAGNPTNNYASLSNSAALANLWLFDDSISDVSFATNLHRLTYLNLERNNITNIHWLSALTNLSGLALSQNPISDYTSLTAFSNLSSLRLENNSLTETNASFLRNLTHLNFLSLNHNLIADLASLNGLPNLNDLYLRRNRLSNIDTLEALPRLLNVDVRLNLLDLSSNSGPSKVIQDLQLKGLNVAYQPQNKAPQFAWLMSNQRPLIYSPLPKWFIPANTNSSLTLSVWEDPPPEDNELVVTAGSSIPSLVSVMSNPLPGTNYSRTLTITAGNAASQTPAVTLSVTDDVLSTGSTNIQVTVVANTALSNVCPNVGPNLAAAISASVGKPVSDLTIVDVLMSSQLYVQNVIGGDPCAWQWLTNLTTLSVGGNAISNLTFLTNLTQLTSLTLNNASATDFSPLAGLSNLLSLSLYGASFSDLSFLTNLTQLSSLTLYKTSVTNLSPLAELTSVRTLHLQQNRLADVLSLTNLSRLSFVDLSLNLLDLNSGSPAMTAIQALASRGVTVVYLPQRQPPAIAMNPNWVIAAGAPSWLYFRVSDSVLSSDFSVAAGAANTNLIPNANLAVGQVANPGHVDWFLNVTSASNQVGTTTISLTAVNDAGLSASTSIVIAVEAPLPLGGTVFPDTNLTSWATSTNARWFGETSVSHAGIPAAQSGSITNNGDSWLKAAVTGPGILSFWWKVSSETNYDFLKFYVGTNEQARISGEVDWRQQSYSFPPGSYTLLWDYSKDPDTSSGMDAGWVTQVSFVFVTWLQVGSSPANGQFQLNLYGQPGSIYQILYSTNLADWFPLGTVTATNSVTTFIDSAAGPGARYYRLQ